MNKRGARAVAVCGAVFTLGAAGVLMGQDQPSEGLTNVPGERYEGWVQRRVALLSESAWEEVDTPTVYTLMEDGEFLGTLIVAPLPGSSCPAHVQLTGDQAIAWVRNGWASFWGPRWPVPRTSRIAAGPRANADLTDTNEVIVIDGPGLYDDAFVRMSDPLSGGVQKPIIVYLTGEDFGETPDQKEPFPTGMDLRRGEQFTRLVQENGKTSLSAPAALSSLPSDDPLRLRIERIREILKIVRTP